MRSAKPRKHFDVGTALAQRRDGRIRHLQIVVSVCRLQIFVLEEGGRRQDDVSIVGGIGKKLLVHDGEQIRTLQTADHRIVIGTDRRRIRVVDKERLDRRIVKRVQRRAQCHHVDGARGPSQRFLHQVGPLQGVFVQPKGSAGGKLQSAADFLPRAGNAGQHGDRARSHATAFGALHSVV